MRTVGSWLLILIAALFAFVGLTMPMTLPSQAAEDRAYYAQFKQAAEYYEANGHLPTEYYEANGHLPTEYYEANGHLPTDPSLRRLESSSHSPTIWPSVTKTLLDCDPSFTKAASDRFVLSFWRGEWSECYAYPSGRTSLPMSVTAYLLSGLGMYIAVYWLIAVAAVWGAIRLKSHPRTILPNDS